MSETALSNVPQNYSFLQDNNAAQLTTPLETADQGINRFAKYHTGTLALAITPAMVEQCAVLRSLQVTIELRRLSSVVAQLQASFEAGGIVRAIADPALIAEELPYTENLEDFTDDMLERSALPVEYIDCTPSVRGVPAWDRLPGERTDFYNVFKLYRDSRYFLLETGEYAIINRTLAGLARQLCLPGLTLTYIAKLYSWKTRCAMYDNYMESEAQKRKVQQETLLCNDHLLLAQKLCNKAWAALEKDFSKLAPKELLSALELGIKYSRISAGLLPDKPGATVAGNQTNLSFYTSTTNNTADKMLNINAAGGTTGQGAGSAVERQLQQDMKEENNLLSILHVLQASGAMSSAVYADLKENEVTEVGEDELTTIQVGKGDEE